MTVSHRGLAERVSHAGLAADENFNNDIVRGVLRRNRFEYRSRQDAGFQERMIQTFLNGQLYDTACS